MLASAALLTLGLTLLIWSADKLVYNSAFIAKKVGISPLVIGMTVFAIGSSIPETMVSSAAALDGKTNTAVGNVLGSNIANITLVLGVVALVRPLRISSTIRKRDLPIMVSVSTLAGVFLWDSYISFYEGILLLSLFGIFILGMIGIGRSSKGSHPVVKEKEPNLVEDMSSRYAIFWLVVSLTVLPLSAGLFVENAVTIAKYFGIHDLVIGLTIIAVGTSLPELAASLAGVLRGEDDMALGNVVGSNIFNTLAVMGVTGILHPSFLSPLVMGRDYWIMLVISVFLTVMALGKSRRISRVEGVVLSLCFVAYQTYLFLNMAG